MTFFSPYTQTVHFSSEENLESVVLLWIDKAESSIKIAMYSLRSDKILEALIKAKERGVQLEIYLDEDNSKKSTRKFLARHEIPFTLEDRRKLHHKFAVFDEKTLLVGSYNWKGDDQDLLDSLIVTDQESLVSSYQKEFAKLK